MDDTEISPGQGLEDKNTSFEIDLSLSDQPRIVDIRQNLVAVHWIESFLRELEKELSKSV